MRIIISCNPYDVHIFNIKMLVLHFSVSYLCAGIRRSPATSMTSHSCRDLRQPSILRKVTSAWDRAVNIQSSGHAHGSIDTHEDSVALLLDVLCPHSDTQTKTGILHKHTDTRTNRHKEKETEALSACVDADSVLFKTKRQMCGESYDGCFMSSMSHLPRTYSLSPSLFNRVTVCRQKQTKDL